MTTPTITPEESTALHEQLKYDIVAYWEEGNSLGDPTAADNHALSLAIARERGRITASAQEHVKRCEALSHQIGYRYDQRYTIAIEALEAVIKKVRSGE